MKEKVESHNQITLGCVEYMCVGWLSMAQNRSTCHNFAIAQKLRISCGWLAVRINQIQWYVGVVRTAAYRRHDNPREAG